MSAENVDVYDTLCWFLDAINAQACVDGGPEPDLSWFEREFLRDNIEFYHKERVRRMTTWELLDGMATEGAVRPDQPLLDVSDWQDVDLINAVTDERYGDSAVAELVKRANAKRVTISDYLKDVVIHNPRREKDSPAKGSRGQSNWMDCTRIVTRGAAQVHALNEGSGTKPECAEPGWRQQNPRQKLEWITMKTNDDEATRRALLSLEQYPATDLIYCLEHEVREIRERAIAELKRRAEVYEAADGLAWMWQNAMKNKAYGGGAL
jgi:hypothetical protein